MSPPGSLWEIGTGVNRYLGGASLCRERFVTGRTQRQAQRLRHRHVRLKSQAQRETETRQGQSPQAWAKRGQAEQKAVHGHALFKHLCKEEIEAGQSGKGAEDDAEERQSAANAGETEAERVVRRRVGIVPLVDDAEEEDQHSEDKNGEDELRHRPGDLTEELPPQLHLPGAVLLQLREHLRQHSGCLADVHESQEQGRKGIGLVLQGLRQAMATLQLRGNPFRAEAQRRRPFLRLMPKSVGDGQPGAEIVAQVAAQIGQVGERQSFRGQHGNVPERGRRLSSLYNDRMNYDPRYLAGVLFFNATDFFEAHEVWEDLWTESYGDDRRFVQGLIQAAVGLFHYSSGNLGGAVKLYRTSREYMAPVGSPFWGLDVNEFWKHMETCYRPLLGPQPPDPSTRPDSTLIPTITLDPPPESWPNPEDFIDEED